VDDGIFLSDVSERDKPWDLHRWQSDLVQALYDGTDFTSYATRISKCSQFLGFNWTSDELTGDVSLRLDQARFCRVRYCPVCQWRKSLMWRARFYNAVPRILEVFPSHRFIFLTLTVQNCSVNELGSVVASMNQAWSKLTRRKVFPAVGWLKSVEVTRNQTQGSKWLDTAHPHFHALLMVDSGYFVGRRYIKQSVWRELWRDVLGVNYLPVVNVKSVKAKFGQDYSHALRSALTETLKYTVKPGDLIGDRTLSESAPVVANRSWLIEITRQLSGSRSISVGGVLRDFIRDSDPEDLIHAEDSPCLGETSDDADIWFNWHQSFKRYRSSKGG